MANPAQAVRCGRSARLPCLTLLLVLSLCAAAPRPCASGAVRGDPTAAAPTAATDATTSSAARFAALPGPTQALVSDVVSMLHGGLPTHSGDMLAQLHEFVSSNEMHMDASSCIFAAGMVAGGFHNAIHMDQPSMQWPFQQYSGSIHWLRRLRGGLATAADKALLEDSTYSSRYPAALWSDWAQVRPRHPFHPHESWICPAPLYDLPGRILEHLKDFPDLSTTMVVGWQEAPGYHPIDGRLIGVDLQVRVVDIDNPAGPACEGCQPYLFMATDQGSWEDDIDGDMDACSSLWEEEQHAGGGEVCGGGSDSSSGSSDSGWVDDRPQYVTDYFPEYHAHEPLPWRVGLVNNDEWSALEWAVVVTTLVTFVSFLGWWVWDAVVRRRYVAPSTRGKALRARQRHQQQQQEQREQQGHMHKWLWLPRLVLGWVDQVPGGRVPLCMLLAYVSLHLIDLHWPAGASSALGWWGRVQQALGPVVADSLGNAAITVVYWSCLKTAVDTTALDLLMLLAGSVVAQAGLHWWVGGARPPAHKLTSQVWSWVGVSAAIGVGVVILPYLLGTPLQATRGQQQQRGTMSEWLRLPRLVFDWVDDLPGGRVVLYMQLCNIVCAPIEVFWPSGAASILALFSVVQQALHPLVARCLGNAAFMVVLWRSMRAKNPALATPLHAAVLGVCVVQAGLHWWARDIPVGVATLDRYMLGQPQAPIGRITSHMWSWFFVSILIHLPMEVATGVFRTAPCTVTQQHQRRRLRSSVSSSNSRSTHGSSSSGTRRQRQEVAPHSTAPSTSAAAAAGQQAAVVVRGAAGAGGQHGWAGLVTWVAQLGGVASHGREGPVGPQQSSRASEAATPAQPAPTTASASAAAGGAGAGQGHDSSANITHTKTHLDEKHQQQQQDHAAVAAAPAGEHITATKDHHSAISISPQNHHGASSNTNLVANGNHSNSFSTSTSTSSTAGCCRVCGVARGPGVKLFKCSKCGGAADRYCSGTCFKVDWPRHKVSCKAAASPATPGK